VVPKLPWRFQDCLLIVAGQELAEKIYENKGFEGQLVKLFRVSRDFEWEARTELFRVGQTSNRKLVQLSNRSKVEWRWYSFRIGQENRLIYSPQPACELTEHL
jgi:hypothetical protein